MSNTIGLEAGDRIPLRLGTERRYGVLRPHLIVRFGNDQLAPDEEVTVASFAAAAEVIRSRLPDAHIDSFGQVGTDWLAVWTSDVEAAILAAFYSNAAVVVREEFEETGHLGAGSIVWPCALDST